MRLFVLPSPFLVPDCRSPIIRGLFVYRETVFNILVASYFNKELQVNALSAAFIRSARCISLIHQAQVRFPIISPLGYIFFPRSINTLAAPKLPCCKNQAILNRSVDQFSLSCFDIILENHLNNLKHLFSDFCVTDNLTIV